MCFRGVWILLLLRQLYLVSMERSAWHLSYCYCRIFRWKGTMTERRRTTLKATEKTRPHTATTWRHHPAPSTTAATRLTTRRTHLWVRTAPSDYWNPAGKTNLAPSSDLNACRVRIHPRTSDNHSVFSPSSSPVVQPDFYCTLLANARIL